MVLSAEELETEAEEVLVGNWYRSRRGRLVVAVAVEGGSACEGGTGMKQSFLCVSLNSPFLLQTSRTLKRDREEREGKKKKKKNSPAHK